MFSMPGIHSLTRLRGLPLMWWLCAIGLSIATGYVVTTAVQQARENAARYGETVAVAVTAREITIGDTLSENDFTIQEMPKALLPDARPISHARGLVITANLPKGTVIVDKFVATAGLSSIAAQLQDDERAVTFARNSKTSIARKGDWVDVVAIGDTTNQPPANQGVLSLVVARSVHVIDATDSSITVAVASKDVGKVAYVASRNAAVLALTLPAPNDRQ